MIFAGGLVVVACVMAFAWWKSSFEQRWQCALLDGTTVIVDAEPDSDWIALPDGTRIPAERVLNCQRAE